MNTKPALQKILKGILHTDGEEKQLQKQQVRKKINFRKE
jgi:hypothetical protein